MEEQKIVDFENEVTMEETTEIEVNDNSLIKRIAFGVGLVTVGAIIVALVGKATDNAMETIDNGDEEE